MKDFDDFLYTYIQNLPKTSDFFTSEPDKTSYKNKTEYYALKNMEYTTALVLQTVKAYHEWLHKDEK